MRRQRLSRAHYVAGTGTRGGATAAEEGNVGYPHERNAGNKLQRAPGNDERRHERCWSAVGSKLVGGSRLVHNAESLEEEDESKSGTADPLSLLHVTVSLMCGDQMSDGGWRRGDVKPSNALLDGAITDDDALMLP